VTGIVLRLSWAVVLLASVSCGETFTALEVDDGVGGRGNSSDGDGGRRDPTNGGRFGGSGGRGFGPNGGSESNDDGGANATGGIESTTGGSANGTGGDDSSEDAGSTGASGGSSSAKTTFEDDFSESLDDRWFENQDFEVSEVDGELSCTVCTVPLLSRVELTVPFEGGVHLAWFPEQAQEANFVVLAHGESCDQVEVSYSAADGVLHVYACYDEVWREVGSPRSFNIQTGADLSVRIEELAHMEVKVNGELVGEWSLAEYPFDAGAVGVSAMGGESFYFDNIWANEL
jgi:hypothetical protein